MKLYLNEKNAVRKENIVGIFDLDTATVGKDTRHFLSKKEREGKTTVTASDIPISFLIVKDEDKTLRVYMTRNAPKALCRRAERFGI